MTSFINFYFSLVHRRSIMSGCLDRVRCGCDCDCLEPVKEWLRPKRNMFASIIAGTLFSLGWWAVIDACAEYAEPIYVAFHLCGIVSTIALLMINAVSTGQVTGETYTEGCLGQRGARAWLFVGFMLAFAGLIGSLWIFIQQFLVPAVTAESPTTPIGNFSTTDATTALITTVEASSNSPCFPCWWQGISFFVQNLLIFISALVFKFGRTEEEEW